jgi:hypothetical protein
MTRLGRQDGDPLIVDLRDKTIQTFSQLWGALAAPCGLPEWFGCNLNAWNDTLNGCISAALDEHPLLIIKISCRDMFSPGNKDGQAFIDVTNAWNCARVELTNSTTDQSSTI